MSQPDEQSTGTTTRQLTIAEREQAYRSGKVVPGLNSTRAASLRDILREVGDVPSDSQQEGAPKRSSLGTSPHSGDSDGQQTNVTELTSKGSGQQGLGRSRLQDTKAASPKSPSVASTDHITAEGTIKGSDPKDTLGDSA